MAGSRVTRLAVLLGLTGAGRRPARSTPSSRSSSTSASCWSASPPRSPYAPATSSRWACCRRCCSSGLVTLVARGPPRLGGASPSDGLVQAVVSGLAHRASGLMAAYAWRSACWPCASASRVKRRASARTDATQGYSNREGSPAPDARHLGRRLGEVDDGGGLRAALAGVDHRVQPVIELLLDRPAVGHRLARRPASAGCWRAAARPAPRAAPARPGGRGCGRRRCASWGASAAWAPRRWPGG